MTKSAGSRAPLVLRLAAACGILLVLSGCVLVPVRYPRYAYHPYRYYYVP